MMRNPFADKSLVELLREADEFACEAERAAATSAHERSHQAYRHVSYLLAELATRIRRLSS